MVLASSEARFSARFKAFGMAVLAVSELGREEEETAPCFRAGVGRPLMVGART